MYIYSTKTQLCYKKTLSFGFYNISPDSFYTANSPLFYLCAALFINPFFRYVRSILCVVDSPLSAQVQTHAILGILSFGIMFALSFLLRFLEYKYKFTTRILGSKFFQNYIYTGLAIENFLRSPKNCYFFGVLFGIYVYLLFWVLFSGYSFSFKDTHFLLLGGKFFGTVLCIAISVYIKCRSSIISHSTLGLKPREKITRWSILRAVGYYRPIEERPIFDSIHNPNKVYPNCTVIFEKKGINGIIEGVYNFRTHVTFFLRGVASTILAYCSAWIFEYSIDGRGGLRSIVMATLIVNRAMDEDFLKKKTPSDSLMDRVFQEMLEECENKHDRVYLILNYGEPSFKKEEIKNRVQAHLDKEVALCLKSTPLSIEIENGVSEKSFLYFLYPKNYIKLRKMVDFCNLHNGERGLCIGLEEIWKS